MTAERKPTTLDRIRWAAMGLGVLVLAAVAIVITLVLGIAVLIIVTVAAIPVGVAGLLLAAAAVLLDRRDTDRAAETVTDSATTFSITGDPAKVDAALRAATLRRGWTYSQAAR